MKPLTKLFFLLSVLLSPLTIFGAQKSFSFSIVRYIIQDEQYPEADPVVHHRVPPHPISCIITENGVEIPGVDSDDIILYEIYSENNECMGSTTNFDEFLSILESLSGEYMLQFTTVEKVYIGIVSIE